MAERAYFLSEKDVVVLRDLAAAVRRGDVLRPKAHLPIEQDWMAPETYTVLVPDAGIPAISGAEPGEEECEVYQPTNEGLQFAGFSLVVRNLSPVTIPSGYCLAARDKFGSWYALPGQAVIPPDVGGVSNVCVIKTDGIVTDIIVEREVRDATTGELIERQCVVSPEDCCPEDVPGTGTGTGTINQPGCCVDGWPLQVCLAITDKTGTAVGLPDFVTLTYDPDYEPVSPIAGIGSWFNGDSHGTDISPALYCKSATSNLYGMRLSWVYNGDYISPDAGDCDPLGGYLRWTNVEVNAPGIGIGRATLTVTTGSCSAGTGTGTGAVVCPCSSSETYCFTLGSTSCAGKDGNYELSFASGCVFGTSTGGSGAQIATLDTTDTPNATLVIGTSGGGQPRAVYTSTGFSCASGGTFVFQSSTGSPCTWPDTISVTNGPCAGTGTGTGSSISATGLGTAATASAGAMSVTLSGVTVQAGDLLLVAVGYTNTGSAPMTATYGVQVLTLVATVGSLRLYSLAVASTTTATVSITWTENTRAVLFVTSVAGLTSNTLDQSATASGGAGGPLVGPTGTTTQADEYVCAVSFSAGTVATLNPGAWVAPVSGGQSASLDYLTTLRLNIFEGYQIAGATGTFTGDIDGWVGSSWFAVIATFK